MPDSFATLRARLAAHESWANTDDRAERTKAARAAAEDRFHREAKRRWPDLGAAEIAKRAEHLRQAHYTRMAMLSAQARRRKADA